MMCLELETLFITLKRQKLEYSNTLVPLVEEKSRESDFDLSQMAKWVAGLAKAFGLKKDVERKELDGLNLEYLSYIGLGNLTFAKPIGILPEETQITVPQCKRMAGCNLKKNYKRELEN